MALDPCLTYPHSLPPSGAAVFTGAWRRRGGGPAARTRWFAARAAARRRASSRKGGRPQTSVPRPRRAGRSGAARAFPLGAQPRAAAWDRGEPRRTGRAGWPLSRERHQEPRGTPQRRHPTNLELVLRRPAPLRSGSLNRQTFALVSRGRWRVLVIPGRSASARRGRRSSARCRRAATLDGLQTMRKFNGSPSLAFGSPGTTG